MNNGTGVIRSGLSEGFIYTNSRINGWKRFITYAMLCVFTFNAVFLPYDNFGLKKLCLALIIAINIEVFINIC